MSLILGIETSTKTCSVAISKGDKLLGLKEVGGEYSHSENLNHFIEVVCTEVGVKLIDIDAVAVSKGPGSYTGLRIGVSSAKGLCYGLEKPLISVETTKVLAVGVIDNYPDADSLFCPMIDARRMEVYTAVYNSKLVTVENISAKIIDEQSFEEVLAKKKVVFFGDGSTKCKSVLESNPNAIFLDSIHPSAEFLNRIAFEKFRLSQFEDVAYFEPYYLKEFLATTPRK